MAFTSGTISYTLSTTSSSVTVAWSATLKYTNGTHGGFNVYLNDGSGVNHAIGTIASYTGSGTSRTVTGSGTWSGLSASTTYSSNDIRVVGPSTGTIYIQTSYFDFTTAAPPAPVSQNWAPSISGTGVSGSALTATAGNYSNASTITTKIARNLSGTFSGATTDVLNSPYTVTDSDAGAPPYYYATYDKVVGTDGLTYNFYSSVVVSKLKVSFNANGATAIDPISYIANSNSPASIQLPYTSRTGYTFNGWYTALTGGSYVGGAYSSYTPSTSASTTLYARWTALPVSQNWSPSLSGTAVSGTSLTGYAGSYNNAASVDTRIAYNTTGTFSDNEQSRSTPYTVTDSDASYYPFYFATKDTVTGTDGLIYYYYSSAIISKLKVSFNTQGGGYNPDPISYIAASPANYITLPYTYKDNYTFNGWYTAASGGTRIGGIYDSYQPSTSVSTTLYAQWTLTPISRYYSPSIYGSGVSGESLSVSSGGYSSNGTYLGTSIAYGTENDFSSYEGTSTQWFQTKSSPYTVTDSDASNPPYYYAAIDSVRNVEGTVFYYYSSSIKSRFRITYDYQYSGMTTSETFYSAPTNPTLTLPSPYRSGYTLSGWYDSAVGGTKIGDGGESYVPPNSNRTLYAQWIASQYTLTYDANGGSVSPTSKNIEYGEQYGTLPTPSRPGYTFVGWYTDLSYSYQVLESSLYETDNDSRIYAKWQGNTYVLTLYPNFPLGGKLDGFYSQNNIVYGSPYGELPVLTRSGYTFSGWYDSAIGGSQILSTDIYMLEQNSDLYAQWIASTPIFSDQTVTTTAYLNKDVSTLFDNTVTASPVTSYSIVYSGSGMDPSSWLSVSKQSGNNNGVVSGKPPQIGTYTFVIRATNQGSGNTDSGLITMTVLPVGKRSLDSSMTSLTTAKRFDGSSWVSLKIMRRFDGTAWQDISNI